MFNINDFQTAVEVVEKTTAVANVWWQSAAIFMWAWILSTLLLYGILNIVVWVAVKVFKISDTTKLYINGFGLILIFFCGITLACKAV